MAEGWPRGGSGSPHAGLRQADHAVVPPSAGFFSSRITRAPSPEAAIAAATDHDYVGLHQFTLIPCVWMIGVHFLLSDAM